MIRTVFLVLGSGIAGVRAAIALARHGPVLVVTKEQPTESNTGYAQGGVAAARVLVEEGPLRIRELASWGARFDREEGRLHFTREGAHSRDLPRLAGADLPLSVPAS